MKLVKEKQLYYSMIFSHLNIREAIIYIDDVLLLFKRWTSSDMVQLAISKALSYPKLK